MSNDALSGLDDLSGLNSEGELAHLSETINYETDIAPYPFIGIHSGVGSGKNYFIDMLARGYSDPDESGEVQRFPEQTILLITSRRSKVNEIQNDTTIKKDRWVGQWDNLRWVAYDDLDDFEDAMNHMRTIDCSRDPLGTETREIYQRYLPCTCAAIEAYLRKCYMRNDSTTHLWNRFDMIVFDEAHCIRSDANYQTAPYFVLRLLQETYCANQRGSTNCKVVIMTGTPGVLEDFNTPQKYHLIDRMAECRNVTPKNIIFIDCEQSRNLAIKMLTEGTRGVFFFNRTRELLSFQKKVQKEYPQLASGIAVSFSDEKKRKKLEKDNKEVYDRMRRTECYIAKNQRLPDDVQLFLTTERNKEGINIRNTDVKTMIVESHVECSVVQMAGRLREGVDVLYIVTDSLAHDDHESKFEWGTVKDGKIIKKYNEDLKLLFKYIDYNPNEVFACAPQQDKQIAAFIKFVEDKHPYIIFDPFLVRFCLYQDRHESKLYYKRQNDRFDEAASDPRKLCELAHDWYPNADITVACSTERQITQYLEQCQLIGNEITYHQQQELLDHINDLTRDNRKTLGPALKPFGYKFIPSSKKRYCTGKIQPISE